MNTKKQKQVKINVQECEALLSAAYTQIDTLKDRSGKCLSFEAKADLKILRAAIKKLRKVVFK